MPTPGPSVNGWTATGRYVLIDGWFGLRIEQLYEHDSGVRFQWRRVTSPWELTKAMRYITKEGTPL